MEMCIRDRGEEMKEALAHFHLENAFRRIYWKRFAGIRKEMKRLVNEMESYPCLLYTSIASLYPLTFNKSSFQKAILHPLEYEISHCR